MASLVIQTYFLLICATADGPPQYDLTYKLLRARLVWNTAFYIGSATHTPRYAGSIIPGSNVLSVWIEIQCTVFWDGGHLGSRQMWICKAKGCLAEQDSSFVRFPIHGGTPNSSIRQQSFWVLKHPWWLGIPHGIFGTSICDLILPIYSFPNRLGSSQISWGPWSSMDFHDDLHGDNQWMTHINLNNYNFYYI